MTGPHPETPTGSNPDVQAASPGTPTQPGDGSVRVEPEAPAPAAAEPTPSAPATDEPAADVDRPGDGDSAGSRVRRPLRFYAVLLAGVLLIAAAALLGWQLRNAELEQQAREEALAAARQAALNLTSIDSEGFEQDAESVIESATGDFKTDFEGRVEELQQLLETNQVTAEGEVLEAGLVRADRDSATALVVVDSTVTNAAAPEGRVNSYRMRLELEKVGDRWLTSQLEFVG